MKLLSPKNCRWLQLTVYLFAPFAGKCCYFTTLFFSWIWYFYANTFFGKQQSEQRSGIYLGAEIRPYKDGKRIAAYADSYRFQWPKFGVDAPSLGQDYLCQLDFVSRKDLSMFWRIKFEEKFENASTAKIFMALIVPLNRRHHFGTNWAILSWLQLPQYYWRKHDRKRGIQAINMELQPCRMYTALVICL